MVYFHMTMSDDLEVERVGLSVFSAQQSTKKMLMSINTKRIWCALILTYTTLMPFFLALSRTNTSTN